MRRMIRLAAVLCCAVLAANAVLAMEVDPSGKPRKSAELPAWLPEFHADFRTFFLYQNDSDFDDTDPLYDEYGQTVGYLSTLFRPRIIWRPHEAITLFYEMEVGDNIWSANDANLGDPTGETRTIFRHRQFWGSIQLPRVPVYVKSGYTYFYDPTHLVVDRYVGVADIMGEWTSGEASVGAAVIPDTVYEGEDANQAAFDPDIEGYDPARNNFENDDFFFYARALQEIGEGLKLRPGVYVRWDKSEIRRPVWIASPVLHADWFLNEYVTIDIDLAGQIGEFKNGGIDNRDVDLLAGAAQIAVESNVKYLGLRLNTLLLSADNDDRFDLTEHGFQYSGFSTSRTMLLTENWLQDQFSNLDEAAAAQGAGLWVSDLEVSYTANGAPTLFAVVGYGMVLEDRNLNHDPNLGLELDAGWRADLYGELARLTIVSAMLWPGEAAAALANEIDTEATEFLWNIQAAMEIRF